jgi:CubicO group peptidase (beta-lactamase class C family)
MKPSGSAPSWGDRLADMATRAGVPGAVLGIWADERESVFAHGVLSAATRVPATTNSLFQVGSITKAWTGTMIMQLVDEGRLSLDTTVSQVLPGVRLGTPDVAAAVTIRHLLTHTSGIDGDIFADTGRGGDCLERYVDRLAGVAVTHPVGTAYSYCNSGFVLLGRIIEVLDGREWDASLRHRLIEPLGLSQTVTLPEEALLHRSAVGHKARSHEGEPVSVWGLPRSLGPAGLITASAADLLTFARIHLDGGTARDGRRLLSKESAAAMRQQEFEVPGVSDRADAVGLAWQLSAWGGRPVFGHDGSTVGQSAYLRVDAGARVAACLLTNSASADTLYRELFSEVFEALAGITMPARPEPADGPPDVDLGRLTGRYERTSRRCEVFACDGALRLRTEITGDLARFIGSQSEEVVLHPSDATGHNYVCRSREDEPWNPVNFGRLADQRPFLHIFGRITLRVQ